MLLSLLPARLGGVAAKSSGCACRSRVRSLSRSMDGSTSGGSEEWRVNLMDDPAGVREVQLRAAPHPRHAWCCIIACCGRAALGCKQAGC